MSSKSLRRVPWLLGSLLCAVPRVAHGATYYVSPTGSDGNAGSEALPFASIAKAQTVVTAGDTVYFRGGTYAYTKGTTACASQTASISGVELSKSGSAGKLIKYWAAPGEKPVFDFDGIRDSCRIRGFYVSGSYIHLRGFEIKGVRQNNDLNHESWGVWIKGGGNDIFEQLDLHGNMGPGLFIQGGGNNLVKNCDSHDNFDELTSNGAGESADGFGCHVGAADTGNLLTGNRAWWNSDDGYDFINANAACTVEHSWAWLNGYKPGTMTAIGNGNGFKSGGYGTDTSLIPAHPAKHTTRFCLAFKNRSAGFYANHHPVSSYFYDNTSYGNNPNFNMLGIDASTGADTTVGVYRNNVALGGTNFSNRNDADDANNAWSIAGVTVSEADFQSVETTGLDAPRQADGSLPVLKNFHLATGSDLIDQGANVGLSFAGSAPDLGAFESGEAEVGTSGGAPGSGGALGGGGSAGSGMAGGAPSGAGGGAPSGAGGGGGTSETAGNAGALSVAGAGVAPSAGSTATVADSNGAPGCSCSTERRGSSGLPFAGLFAVLALFARRPRGSRRVTFGR